MTGERVSELVVSALKAKSRPPSCLLSTHQLILIDMAR